MERLRIYTDTSVIGGCFDPEFMVWSNGLVRDFRARRQVPVLSQVTAAEVASARSRFGNYMRNCWAWLAACYLLRQRHWPSRPPMSREARWAQDFAAICCISH